MGGLILLAIYIGMAVDASNIGYDGDDVPGFAPGPIGWFFFALLLPIIAIPVYLIRRPALKAAAQRRRLQAQTFAALPGVVHGAYAAAYGQPQNPYGGQAPYPGQPQYPGQGPYPGQPHPGPGAYPGQSPYGAQAPYPGAPPQPPQAAYPGQPPQAPYPGQPAQQNPYGGPPPQNPYGAAPQPQPAASPYGAAPPQPPGPPAPGAQAALPSPPPPPSPSPSPSSSTVAAEHVPHAGSSGSMTAGALADGIRQLTDLRDRGLLTEAEFQARKTSLLRKI